MLTFLYQPIAAQTGNVGIGTTNPQANLHVAGDTRIDSTLEIKNSTGETIFRLNPESKSFEFLDTDGSIFYRLAIEEEADNLTEKGTSSGTRNTPDDPFVETITDPSTGNIITTTSTIDNTNTIVNTRVEVQPNGITTTQIQRGLTGSEGTLLTVENPIEGSTTVTHYDDAPAGLTSTATEIFTDAAGTTISVFEDDELVSRRVFDKDGNKVIDFDGNTNTTTPIGTETLSAAGEQLFIDIFGLSAFFTGNIFLGLGFSPTSGLISEGDMDVQGNLSKSSGTFKIDHPLDPTNKWLYHSFVESPDMMNVYNGNVTTDANGEATIELPEYFGELNKDFRYQLTPIGVFAQAIISKKVEDNQFEIKTSVANVEVSWQVTGIRQDDYAKDNRIEVEVEKTGWDKGKLRYDPNRSEPYTKGLQNHWGRHQEKRNRSEKED